MGEAKRKKQRECPAKGGIITPEECGRGRNSSIACPVDCPHNPFHPSNYDEHFAPLEAKVIGYLTRKLVDQLTPAQIREVTALAEAGDEFAFHAHQVWRVHGTGLLQRWMDADFHKEWKNDEQVLLRQLLTLRPSLLEFREVKDELSCTAVDLLEPGEPFTLIDRNTAAQVGRYQIGLCWTYDIPGGRRLSGGMAVPPDIDPLEPAELLALLAEHLGAPPGLPREWLLEHMTLLAEAFSAIQTARQVVDVKASDLRRFTLSFPLPASAAAQVIETLSSDPRVLVEEEGPPFAANLLAEGVDRERDDIAELVGEVRLEPDQLVVESFGAVRADAARALLATMGLPLGPERCEVMDAGAELAARPYDRELVPPAFLSDPTPIDFPTTVRLRGDSDRDGMLERIYRGFADKPNPGLGGKTPRELAADPALRPRVVRLMKKFTTACDRERRTRGADFDFNGVLRDIGLDELILPPPPLGHAAMEDDDDDDIRLDPPPRQEFLEDDLLVERLEAVMGDQALLTRLEVRLGDVLDAFSDLPDKLNENELQLLLSVTLLALGALHPVPPRGYEPNPERMLACYRAWISSLEEGDDLDDYFSRIFEETRQPALCEAVADLMFELEKSTGRKIRPKKINAMSTALAAAIWEAAHWPPEFK
jgi:hypothetical protein